MSSHAKAISNETFLRYAPKLLISIFNESNHGSKKAIKITSWTEFFRCQIAVIIYKIFLSSTLWFFLQYKTNEALDLLFLYAGCWKHLDWNRSAWFFLLWLRNDERLEFSILLHFSSAFKMKESWHQSVKRIRGYSWIFAPWQ